MVNIALHPMHQIKIRDLHQAMSETGGANNVPKPIAGSPSDTAA
ncbi:hypothetical protein RE6C_01560 [Rhodopirellula europaea 6C]|uniref:Uncharacterized protein n=1 Tax=Rhodopirellula europaea 6C TaxID=1263867 RepID=M2B7J6_9BACT|nr:hypothetical protein RE6C_01560 [Rhodopirellula europaea 6C]